MRVIDGNRAKDELLPIFIDHRSGSFTTNEIRLGSRGDSYCGRSRKPKIMPRRLDGSVWVTEYLIKQYLQMAEHERIYQDMSQEALVGIEKHLLIQTKKSKLTFVAKPPSGMGKQASPKMDHLVYFLPGTIALGATGGRTEAEARNLSSWTDKKESEMQIARELMKTCYGMYAVTATSLAPEITWFHAIQTLLQPNSGPARPVSKSADSVKDWIETMRFVRLTPITCTVPRRSRVFS
jgi:mannosyl-oligosaccharide alpha-1,2-mannosidase